MTFLVICLYFLDNLAWRVVNHWSVCLVHICRSSINLHVLLLLYLLLLFSIPYFFISLFVLHKALTLTDARIPGSCGFLVRIYVCECASHLDKKLLADSQPSNRTLAILNQHILQNTDANAWVNIWLHCSWHGRSALRFVTLEVDYTLFRFREEVEYEKELWTLVRCSEGKVLTKDCLFLTIWPDTFSHHTLPSHYIAGRMPVTSSFVSFDMLTGFCRMA